MSPRHIDKIKTFLKMKVSLIFSIIFTVVFLSKAVGQKSIHDFTVTDTHGKTHNLYNDYLSKDAVVVIKFFFTSCPPCIANAPLWQQKYVELGSGTKKVEFFSASILTSDSNAGVAAFESLYNQTMKGVGNDGNASLITGPFRDGSYGSWWGTPSFVVIAPDKSFTYPVFFNDLDDAINQAKTKTSVVTIPPTTVSLNLQSNNFEIPQGHVKLFLKPKNAATPKIEITKNNEGKYAFSYPSTTYPEMTEPEIIMESNALAYTNALTAFDIVTIQKHILGITELSPSYKLLAADVNSDGKITAFDLVTLRKIILGVSETFPNNTPSYKSIPEKLSFSPTPGTQVPLEFTIVKIGNVN